MDKTKYVKKIKDYSILIGISLGTILLILSTFLYPGGSIENIHSEGYDWIINYISNLLRPVAVNGEANSSRPLAIFGVLLLTTSFGLFFVKFSTRIKIKSASQVIKYLGILATLFGLITIIPSMHDIMVTLSSILTLLIFFYITMIIIKSNLTLIKVMSILFLVTFYLGAYMYFARFKLEYMPIMQKVIFLIKIVWILTLEYFTKEHDFEHVIK